MPVTKNATNSTSEPTRSGLPIRRRENVPHQLPDEVPPILQRLYASRGLVRPEQLNLKAGALHEEHHPRG